MEFFAENNKNNIKLIKRPVYIQINREIIYEEEKFEKSINKFFGVIISIGGGFLLIYLLSNKGSGGSGGGISSSGPEYDSASWIDVASSK